MNEQLVEYHLIGKLGIGLRASTWIVAGNILRRGTKLVIWMRFLQIETIVMIFVGSVVDGYATDWTDKVDGEEEDRFKSGSQEQSTRST